MCFLFKVWLPNDFAFEFEHLGARLLLGDRELVDIVFESGLELLTVLVVALNRLEALADNLRLLLVQPVSSAYHCYLLLL
mmetsp:Transcript_31536/g.41760  ORF Transcript_31536/g.41760 Transcript_31536/m.41760 type:complete len:80 (-) Transcript_31536:12-251(-)